MAAVLKSATLDDSLADLRVREMEEHTQAPWRAPHTILALGQARTAVCTPGGGQNAQTAVLPHLMEYRRQTDRKALESERNPPAGGKKSPLSGRRDHQVVTWWSPPGGRRPPLSVESKKEGADIGT